MEERRNERRSVSNVKNKAPAEIQITAEQLLREAVESREKSFEKPKQVLVDEEEIDDYRKKKRTEFETSIQRNPSHVGVRIRYANWEESQKEWERTRSIYERAIGFDYRLDGVWVKYSEFEMRHGFVNHARNIFERAVSYLPRVDRLWLKYSFMEEILGNFGGARNVFERWMEWKPEMKAWLTYASFEQRCHEIDWAREIYSRMTFTLHTTECWLKWTKFEEKHGNISGTRKVFEDSIRFFSEGEDPDGVRSSIDPQLLCAFAAFEERQKEFDRARAIYKFGLEGFESKESDFVEEKEGKQEKQLADLNEKSGDSRFEDERRELHRRWISFEKQRGSRIGIEGVVVAKRRVQYQKEVTKNPQNYDAWLDWAHLEEAAASTSQTVKAIERVRSVYEKAVTTSPPPILLENTQYDNDEAFLQNQRRQCWERYVYLWINWAIWEELDPLGELEMARTVLRRALATLPISKGISFSKLWLMAAKFEVRRGDVGRFRKIMGKALGVAARPKLYEEYVSIEMQLAEVDRCRKIYEAYISRFRSLCRAWMSFANFESNLEEIDRARSIYELGINEGELDEPELLWKAYIDFEIEAQCLDKARNLYQRLLERTQHVKVWLSFAKFEEEVVFDIKASRKVFETAYYALKDAQDIGERVLLAEKWMHFEERQNEPSEVEKVRGLQPEEVTNKRQILSEDGNEAGWEEYYDYVFPDSASYSVTRSNLPPILEKAKRWSNKRKHGEN